MARQKEGMSEEEAEKVTESEIEDFIVEEMEHPLTEEVQQTVEEADAVKKQTMEDIERPAKHAGMTPFEYVRRQAHEKGKKFRKDFRALQIEYELMKRDTENNPKQLKKLKPFIEERRKQIAWGRKRLHSMEDVERELVVITANFESS